MKNILVLGGLMLITTITYCQNYRIEKNPKVEQAFTTNDIDSLEVKVKQLQHQRDTVYYEISKWTTVIISPKLKITAIKEDEL